MDNYNDYVNDYMNSYNCPDCNDAKLQSDKNARKINEVIEQINGLIDIIDETVDFIEEIAEIKVDEAINSIIGKPDKNFVTRDVLEGEIFILDTIEQPSEPSEPIPVTGVTLDKSTHNLKVGDTVQLTPTFSPSNATNKSVTWSTSNSNCTITGGLVTAITSGECIITCTTVDGSKTATCNIIIEADDETETQENIRFMFETKNINSGSTEIISNGITATLKLPAVIVDGGLSLNKNILTIPHTQGLQNRPFTIEFILKYDNSIYGVENTNYSIFDTRYGTGSGNGYRIGSFFVAGQGRKGYVSLAGALGVDVQISDGVDIIDGVERTWKFIFTGTQVKTYIDGVLNKTSSYNYQESQRDILIGDNVNSGVVIKKFVLYDGEVI